MRTPLHAMLWELWRTSRVEFLSRIGALCALVAVLCNGQVQKMMSGPEKVVIQGIVIMFLTSVSIMSSAWVLALDRQQSGFTFRLGFTRPVSTWKLVCVPMAFSMVAAVICFAIPASLLGWLLGTQGPMLGQATLIACIITCCMAATWSPVTVVSRVVGFVALVTVAAIALMVLHSQSDRSEPLLMAIGRPDFFAFSWPQYAALLLVAILAFVITTVAVDRQRHGDRWEFGAVSGWRQRKQASQRRTDHVFRSRFIAQCWYETRRFGPTVLLLGVLGPLLIFVFVTVVPQIDQKWRGGPFVWLIALAFCPFVYQIIGAEGAIGLRRKQGAARFSPFDATRAMTNDRLVAAKLLVIALLSLMGWLFMGLVACLHAVTSGEWQAWAKVVEDVSSVVGAVPLYGWVAGFFCVFMLYVSSSSILFAFGMWLPLHPRFFLGLAIMLYLHFFLALWDANHDWTFRYLWISYGYLLSAVIAVGSVLMLCRALSQGYLGRGLFGCAFFLWLGYVSATVGLYLRLAPAIALPVEVVVLAASALLIPLATTAVAPLSLASHRHA